MALGLTLAVLAIVSVALESELTALGLACLSFGLLYLAH